MFFILQKINREIAKQKRSYSLIISFLKQNAKMTHSLIGFHEAHIYL